MKHKPVRILLVEDNPGDVRLLQESLAEAGDTQFALAHVGRLSEVPQRLDEAYFDVILLDLSLPDSRGMSTVLRMHDQAPDVPIVVLTGTDDEALAVDAVHVGAQDYLVKGQIDGNTLARSVRYAIERHQYQEEIRALSLVDELTGLYNRRGFLTLAQQQLKMADRAKCGALLLFADLDNMKWINDNLGHPEGDMALMETAAAIKKTFRASDLIGRMGGDEFAVIAAGAGKDSGALLTARLRQNLEARNSEGDRGYGLSLSIGAVYYDPDLPCTIVELLSQADALMYEQKRAKYERKRPERNSSRKDAKTQSLSLRQAQDRF